MNKSELIEKMAKDAKIDIKSADRAFHTLVLSIFDGLLSKEGTFRITGFGTFFKSHRKARNGVNPATGKKIKIAAKNVVRFRPGKLLKEI